MMPQPFCRVPLMCPDITQYFIKLYSRGEYYKSMTISNYMFKNGLSSFKLDKNFFHKIKKLNLDRELVLNIGRNLYPKGHKYYSMAQHFVGRPLHCYINSLERAEELHLIESSLACLAIHLDLSNVKKKCIYEASSNFLELGVFEEGTLQCLLQ